ncbi:MULTISPECIES: hypothetical protein [unclassified Clostridium]|uniref:hypothetical protein n=1 Tax=unclassified Clostridium TaxID=2614128 RepID=UPI002A831192|nr:hypothetical protein [Clostridium sp.]MDY4253757.1 hypothetical protein [Clostridium sp.]
MEFYSDENTHSIDDLEPCYKTIYELENYLITKYNAELIKKIDERTLKFTKYNIAKDKFSVLLKEIVDLDSYDYKGEDSLLKDIETINNLPKSLLDLDIAQYKFDVTIEKSIIGCFEVIIERNTEYVNMKLQQIYDDINHKNKLMSIMADIILYQGVNKVDIDTKSERFFKYVSAKEFYKNYI